MTDPNPNARLSQLRGMLVAEPTLRGWDAVIRMLLGWPEDAPEAKALALDYAAEYAARWQREAPGGPWRPERVQALLSWEAFLADTVWHMHTRDGDPEHCEIRFYGDGRFSYLNASPDEEAPPRGFDPSAWELEPVEFSFSGVARWSVQEDTLLLVWNEGVYTDTFPDLPALPVEELVGVQGIDAQMITFWWTAHVDR